MESLIENRKSIYKIAEITIDVEIRPWQRKCGDK